MEPPGWTPAHRRGKLPRMTRAARPASLRLVLGDQLSLGLSALSDLGPSDVVLLVEVHDEATHVRHHQQKIALIFSAMRHFAAELEARGGRVDYVRLDAAGNTRSFTGELERAVARHRPAGTDLPRRPLRATRHRVGRDREWPGPIGTGTLGSRLRRPPPILEPAEPA